MIVLNPSFDPQTNTWYLEDNTVSAPTIRDLLTMLGPGYKVANYYPINRRKKANGGSVPKRKLKYDHNEILNLWDRGVPSTEIAKKLNMTAMRVVDTVWMARQKGDPRAKSRRTIKLTVES